MADQLRRLEDTIRKQEDRLTEERDRSRDLQRQFKNDLDRVSQIQNQAPLQPALGAYPSQLNPGLTVDDANDEALMNKLNELEGYLATNPNKYH